MKLVNLTGFNSGGSSAVRDYLLEFDDTEIFPNEFKFFRVKHGIIDLYDSLFNKELTPFDRDMEVKRFIKAMKILRTRDYRLSKFGITNGNLVKSDFSANLSNFVNKLTTDYYYGYSYKLELEKTSIIYIIGLFRVNIRKIVDKILFRKSTNPLISRIGIYTDKIEFFKSELQLFIKSIFTTSSSIKVLLGAIPPDIAIIKMVNHFINNLLSIVLIRDPRDVYVTAMQKKQTWFVGNTDDPKNDSVKNFINHFVTNLNSFPRLLENEKVLIVHFEDLVNDYKGQTSIINDFLGLDANNHSRKLEYFNPEKSISNIGIYRSWANKDDIYRIERILIKNHPILNKYDEFVK
jgi:hypothetical protein